MLRQCDLVWYGRFLSNDVLDGIELWWLPDRWYAEEDVLQHCGERSLHLPHWAGKSHWAIRSYGGIKAIILSNIASSLTNEFNHQRYFPSTRHYLLRGQVSETLWWFYLYGLKQTSPWFLKICPSQLLCEESHNVAIRVLTGHWCCDYCRKGRTYVGREDVLDCLRLVIEGKQ